MAIFDDENNNQSSSSPFSRSTTSRTSSIDNTKEGNIHIGSGVAVNGEINAPNEVIVNGKHIGKIAEGKNVCVDLDYSWIFLRIKWIKHPLQLVPYKGDDFLENRFFGYKLSLEIDIEI